MDAVKTNNMFDTKRHEVWRKNFKRFLREYNLTPQFHRIDITHRQRGVYQHNLIDQWFFFFEKNMENLGMVFHNNVISTVWSTFEAICAQRQYLKKEWGLSELELSVFSSFDIGMIMVILFMDEVMSPLYSIENAIQCEIEAFLKRIIHSKECAKSKKLKKIIAVINERQVHIPF